MTEGLSNQELDALALQIDARPHGAQTVTGIEYGSFLATVFPPRETLLSPWLPTEGLAMIHAPRGIGKTHMALGTAWAVASGGGFLRWQASAGCRRVVLLDGEMPAVVLQERLKRVVELSGLTPPLGDYLQIVASDLKRDGLPDLSDPTQQGRFDNIIGNADLIIVDNISTLCRSLKENEADSWQFMQNWCLAQRRAKKSVLLIHHGGKSGGQRGTSKKEDVLDTVVSLRKPPDYQADQGARFEIHFEKSRGFYGPEAEPFEAWLKGDEWVLSDIKSGDDIGTLKALHAQGMSVRAISERTGISKSTVQRRLEGDAS